ncbi:hypothetical protein [uncultured Allomuricauda sp.]|nr:hypothetical protein [uncultured Allomuricauda sp.]
MNAESAIKPGIAPKEYAFQKEYLVKVDLGLSKINKRTYIARTELVTSIG